LIEEIDGRVRVYCRWDWKFGCWDIDFRKGTRKEVIINWPILDKSGLWLVPKAIRGPAGCPTYASWYFEARAAYAAYFSLVPIRARLLAAPLGHKQWSELVQMNKVLSGGFEPPTFRL
jgi:hypothetical protein